MMAILKALLGLGGEQVGPREAVTRMNRGAVLVDVREPGEFAGCHVAGAIPLPLGRIRSTGAQALDACAVPDDAQVLLICQSGMRSRIGCSLLAGDTRRRYINVDGGMAAWTASDLPVVRDRTRQ